LSLPSTDDRRSVEFWFEFGSTYSYLTAMRIEDCAHAAGVPVHHLAEVEQSLEHAYLSLTDDSVDYHGRTPDSMAEPIANGAAR